MALGICCIGAPTICITALSRHIATHNGIHTANLRSWKGSLLPPRPARNRQDLWAKHQYPNALRIDLLDPETLRSFAAKPERLIEVVEANPKREQVIIDEIQKLPALLEVVHLLIERKLGQQFVLTGSSARKLRRQGVNLLGGRAIQKTLHPYIAAELGSRFSLSKALRQGMLPATWAADDPGAT